MRLSVVLISLLLAAAAFADNGDFEFGGFTKFRLTGQRFPADSLLRDVAGSESIDVAGAMRLNFDWRREKWSAEAAYELVAIRGDSIEWTRDLPPGTDLFFPRLPNDERRLFDLSDVVRDSGKTAIVQRIDRLWVSYSSETTVLRLGRQVLSWGNGLFYTPLDLVNPFDPAAIDTEYKPGDDMLYGQYLRNNGDDLQAAAVFRRDPLTGDVESDQATISAKYHGFAGASEYDLLLARHYGDDVVGVGFGRSLGGAVISGDIVVTDTDLDTRLQLVTNLAYSWTAFGKNMSAAVEYFYNGFGQSSGRYDPDSLIANPDLLSRIGRGELFTIGRHYLAGSVMIELSALWTVTPTLLANAADPSALFQLVTNYSLADNMTFLGSINLPIGARGTEFGGIESGIPDRSLASGAGLFAQFAWYF